MTAQIDKKHIRSIVVIDDDAESQIIIRRYLATLFPLAKIFSSTNGLEGLGAVLVDKPDLIVLDTTLPKYSGLEVIEFVATNKWIKESKVPVVVMHEDSQSFKINAKMHHVLLLSKQDEQFFDKLNEFLCVNTSSKKVVKRNRLFTFGLELSNAADKLRKEYFDCGTFYKIFLFCEWLFVQMLLTFSLFWIVSITKEPRKLYSPSKDKKYAELRLRSYPTLIVFIVLGLILLFEVALLLTGGIVIFNTKINSIFAASSNSVEINLEKATYTPSKVTFENGVFTSKRNDANSVATTTLTPSLEVNPSVLVTPTVIKASIAPPEITTTSGLTSYNSDSGAIVFDQQVLFSVLKGFSEESSANSLDSSSLPVVTEKGEKLSELRDRIFKSEGTQIRYQLSTDNSTWWYVDDSATWTKTELGSQSANTVQEINTYIGNFPKIAGGGNLRIKAFLLSDGTKPATLKKLTVQRLLDVVTPITAQNSKQLTVNDSSNYSVTKDTVLPAPEVLNASFFGGNKLVDGRIDFYESNSKQDISISDEDLARFEVGIYYTSSRDVKKSAEDKTELIGTTKLQKITKFGKAQYVFSLKTPNREGGYVTAQLSYKNSVRNISLDSTLGKPVKNSTFTVNETGDQEDAVGVDGICDYDTITPGSQCTLRAAFSQANVTVGNDTIAFNIPTTDPGFVTYNSQSTPSSGSAVDGESFWKIQQPYEYASWDTTGVVVDGATQTSNQLDSNTFGPEVEIDNTTNTGISFRMEAPAKIYDLVMNRSTDRLIYLGSTDNSEVLRCYIGLDPKGYQALPMPTSGIYVASAISNVSVPLKVGTSTTDGNKILAKYGIVTQNNARVSVKGNIIGLDKYENIPAVRSIIGLDLTLATTGSFLEVGGLPSERNIISGMEGNPIVVAFFDASTDIDLKILGNYIGTDSTGTLNRGATSSGIFIGSTNTTASGVHPRIKIGDRIAGTNYGNLVRYNLRGIRANFCGRGIDIGYNTVSDNDRSGISVEAAPTETDVCDTKVINNHIGYSSSDPYFSLAVGANKTLGGDPQVKILGSSATFQGNMVDGTGIVGTDLGFGFGIKNGNVDTRTNNSNDQIARPRIGGTSVLADSLCSGLEANCIINNPNLGIFSLDTVPVNEATLYTDNTFTNNGPSGNRNIEVARSGLFELFDGLNRRTNATDASLTVNVPGSVKIRTADAISTSVSTLTNYKVTCISAADCPANGQTGGEAGKTEILAPTGTTATVLSTPDSWPRITQYIVDGSGVKTSYATYNLSATGVSMNAYIFSGDATANSFSTGATRTISGQTYHDRGEPWTDKPTANGNIASGNFARFQIAEMEWLDPNRTFPITVVSPKGTIDDPRPTFTWNGSADANISTYKVYLDGNLIGTTTKPTVTLPYASADLIGPHTWQVKGYKANNSLSGVSPVTDFSVVKTTVLELISPIDEIVINTGTPLLDWNNDTTKNVTYFEIYMDDVLFKKIDLASNTSYQILDSETLSESTHEWYVVAYYTGVDSSGTSVNKEVARTAKEKFTVKYDFQLKFTKVVGKNEKDKVTNVDLAWEESGNVPPVGSTYKLTFVDQNNTDLFGVKNIPNTANARELTSEVVSRLSVNTPYTIRLDLLDNKGKVLATTTGKILLPYKQQFSGGGVLEESGPITPVSVGGAATVAVLETALFVVSPGSYNISYIVFAIFDRLRKRTPWGVVYDSVNKRYVGRAIIRLYEMGSNELIATTVTDALGIFKLTPKVGNYYIKVMKTGYEFPSKTVVGQTDNGFLSVYHGESIAIKQDMQPVSISIPIDNKNISHSTDAFKASFGSRLMQFVERVNVVLVLIGFVLSIIAVIGTPSLLNIAIFGFYLAFFAVKLYLLRLPKFGKVVEPNGSIVEGIEVGLYEPEFDTLLTKTYTNERGEYMFYVPNGTYMLRILDSHFVMTGRTVNKGKINVMPQRSTDGIMIVKTKIVVEPKQK